MKKIKTILLSLFVVCNFTSCVIDNASFGVDAVSYPYQRECRPVRVYNIPSYKCYNYNPYWRYTSYSSSCESIRRYRHCHR